MPKIQITNKGFTPLEITGSYRRSPKGDLSLTGFTFAETMVSVLIFSILAMAILSVLTIGQKAWHSDVGKVELQQQARLAMDGMIREVRESSSAGITQPADGGNSAQLDFTTVEAGGTISYYLESNQLIREYPAGTEKILSGDVETVNFSLSGDVLIIQLDLGKSVYGADLNFSLKEQVRLRNG
ncbi:MAG: hypothetical protein Q7J72_03510 [Candidatus Omnitrophota bacterium]|nr:hypothetical protein [Candidatus Omnitrophota bacterium]